MSALPDDLRDVVKMHEELVGLRARFLTNTTKLAKMCAAFGISADLDDRHFDEAVEANRPKVPALQMARRAAAIFTSPAESRQAQVEQLASELRLNGLR